VLEKISEEHPQRNQLLDAVKGDLDGITQFIREKKIVSLSSRDDLKLIPTPEFMRGIYSVAGFHGPPPLEPTAEAQYRVTPIDPKRPEAKAESKLREYNNFELKWLTIHEALPGHYIQFEQANDVQPVTRRLVRNLSANGAYVEGWARVHRRCDDLAGHSRFQSEISAQASESMVASHGQHYSGHSHANHEHE
jgi:hypothetical protein